MVPPWIRVVCRRFVCSLHSFGKCDDIVGYDTTKLKTYIKIFGLRNGAISLVTMHHNMSQKEGWMFMDGCMHVPS